MDCFQFVAIMISAARMNILTDVPQTRMKVSSGDIPRSGTGVLKDYATSTFQWNVKLFSKVVE